MVIQIEGGLYAHSAWADSSDGKTGFTLVGYEGKAYVGTYTSSSATESTDPRDYTWKVYEEEPTASVTTTVSNARPSTDNRTQLESQQVNQDNIADEIGAASTTANYFWFESTGTYAGANITQEEKDAFIADTTNDPTAGGGNVNISSSGVLARDGLMDFAAMTQRGLEVTSYDGNGDPVKVAHLGYGPGESGGGIAYAPYYDLGTRLAASTIGNYSTAEGVDTTASGARSHAEGHLTTASELNAHAEGYSTNATSYEAHAEGSMTTASGDRSHAEGEGTEASGSCSHAEGYYTIAASDYQSAVGAYNISDPNDDYALIVGNGTADNARSNAFAVGWDGLPYTNDHDGAWGNIYDLMYPVGSVYQTTDSTFDPNDHFGGTWTQITDTFLMAAGTTYPGGTTGGSATATLRRSDLPNDSVSTNSYTHSHWFYIGANGGSGTARTVLLTSGSTRNTSDDTHSHTFDLNGGVTQTDVSILPPYKAVYTWERTA